MTTGVVKTATVGLAGYFGAKYYANTKN